MKLKNYLLTATLCSINKSVFFMEKVKKNSLLNILLLLFAIFLNTSSHAQNFKTFTVRYNTQLKGDMHSIGNNILGINNNPLNDNNIENQMVSMQYIDIDSDPTTFNSSSADLQIPTNPSCYRIAYAGLYWGGIIKTGDSRADIDKVKLKLPGSATYTDITGEIIYDAVAAPIVPDQNKPYAGYADVTSLVSGLANPLGTYTAANIQSSTGLNGATGLAAGWTLFVVYEDPTAAPKSITSLDGFSALYDGRTLDIPITGFLTPPTGPINLKYSFATLNGDKTATNKVEISNGVANGTALITTQRPSNNFFNSSVTSLNNYLNPRNPSGSNSLGYDTGIEELLNVNKSTVDNNASYAEITLQVARGQANPVFSFFNALAIDIIRPEIKLTKLVTDISGTDIGNTDVGLGTDLYYEIGFQNIGNDNITKFTIKDVLPENIIFNYPADITSLPAGVTHTYNATTRELIFTIPDDLVEIGDVPQNILLHVQVVPNYYDLATACGNEVKNQAFATYQGVKNPIVIQDEGSFATKVCNFGAPSSTNFIVNIDGQTFNRNAVLCGASILLTGPDGYDTYSWSTDPSGSPVISTDQVYSATSTGTYYLTSTSPCATVTEAITVIPFGNTVTNPVIPYADDVAICPNDGKALPSIFLCGANANRFIQTNITDATSIIWEKLNESSCAPSPIADCANENPACQWNSVGSGPDYLANTAGQFRVTLNYPGGCFSRFYFNVYQNLLAPTATSRDIICTTNGEITVGGVPSGYEYSLDGSNYQSSNVFSIPTAGSYTVYIRQVGVPTNPCIFTVPDILVRQRNFTTTTIVTQPLCNGDKGTITIGAQDAYPQYYYSLYQGATLVNSVGPIMASDYQFANLNPGTYTVRVWTDDGCDYSTDIEILEPPLLTATSALTKPLTCVDGEITVYPVGGTPPYSYYINGSVLSQSVPQIVVTNPLPPGGLYSIEVADSQDCRATTTITVTATPDPVYTINSTNLNCFGDSSGQINFDVTNANGYTLAYSIDNGATYVANPTFSNLSAGTYTAILRYSLAGTDCFSSPQTITISQPAAALTASVAVTELAGCGTNGEGKIAITNPQGGTPFAAPNPYLYSFDNQSTWVTTNEAYLMPGTYTVYVKDANDCIFPMNITIDPEPLAPTISVSNPVFNCDGTATITVNITNNGSGNFTYEYLLDNVTNSNNPSNVFVNVAPGNHTVSIKYTQISASNPSALSCTDQEDFPIVVPTDEAFVASITGFQNVTCSGANDGTITIAADNFNPANGFQYSIDGGANWITQMTSPYTITGLAAATYDVQMRYDASSTGVCVKTFTQIITQPAPLTANASVTSPAKCIIGATITASASGGTPAYQYELRDGSGVTVIRPYQANADFTDIPAGSYTVFVRDANSCITVNGAPVDVIAPPTLTASIDAASDICYDSVNQATLIVNTVGGTAPFTYTLDTNAPQNSNTFNNVGPGNHTIIVTDSYGCTATPISITIAPQLTSTSTISKELDCTVSPNAVISGTIADGYSPYVVSVISGPGPGTLTQPTATTFSYTTAVAGTYQFQITDAQGCTTTTTAIINAITDPTLSETHINVSCNGGSDGSVQLIAASGSGGYTYSIDGTNYVSNSSFTGLSIGTYTFYVKDSKECTANISVTLTEPVVLTASASAIPFSCSVSNTKQSATITVSAANGTSPYTYSFNGGSFTSTNTLTVNDNGTDQTINYQVRDANGCITAIQSITLNGLNPPTDLDFSSNAITCLATTTDVTLTPTNGVGPLSYAIISPAASTGNVSGASSGVFTGLAPDTYTFRVTDANGCYYTESYIIDPVTPIAVSGNKTSDVLCFGGNSGSIEYTVSGFAGTYSYVFNGEPVVTAQSSTTIVKNNLTTGTYQINITDEVTGCTTNTSITINQPAAALNLVLASNVNANCNVSTSAVTVTASGGTPSYTYSFVQDNAPEGTYTSSNTANLDPTTNLNWDVYVKDANGCTFKLDVTIAQDPTPTVTASVPNQCSSNGSSYTITAVGSGGVGALTYSIGSGFQASPNFTVTTPGDYTVTVKDANNCTATTSVTVYPILTADDILIKDLTCSVPTEATIQVNATGGNGAYTYRVSLNGGAFNSTTLGAGNIYTTSTAGSYRFEITDLNGCTRITNPVNVTTPVTVTASTSQVNPTCNGYSDGSITLTALTGLAPFTYSINGGASFVSSNVFGGLTSGSYNYVVRDSKGCDATGTINIIDPAPINVNIVSNGILCNPSTPGSFDVSVASGGTAPYTYTLYDNTFTLLATFVEAGGAPTATHNFGGLVFGDYYINVVDANGCEFRSTKQRIETVPFLDLTSVVDSNNCATGVDLLVTASGGVAPYTYSILGQPETAPTGNSYTFVGLNHNSTYFLQVKDFNGCISILEATTPAPPSTIEITGFSKTDVTCFGANDGTIAFTVQNYEGTVTNINYQILNSYTNLPIVPAISGTLIGPAGGPVSGNIAGLSPGNYILRATEATGTLCSASYSFDITQPLAPLNSTITAEINANCNSGSQLTLNTTGGTGPYQYAVGAVGFSPVPADFSSNNVLNLDYNIRTNWDIVVRDANLCEVRINKTITKDPEPEIALAVTDNCAVEGSFEITVNQVSAGIAPYTISINGGAFQNIAGLPHVLSNLNSGTYTIVIKDANGCTDSESVTLYRKISSNSIVIKDLDCTITPDATITLTITDGLNPSTYEVSTNGGSTYSAPTPIIGSSVVYTTPVSGTYTFRYTDANGCTSISTATIDPLVTPNFTFVQTNETCIDSNDGTVTITPTAGVAPFTYSIDNGVSFQASNVFTGLNAAGTYNIIIKDSKSCDSAPQPLTITEPTAVGGSGVLTQGLTCGAGNATQAAIVTITGSGGTAPYTYSFNGGTSYTSSNTFTTYTAGTVSALVKDSNGCIIATAIDVDVPALVPPTDLMFTLTSPVTCLANATVDITGVTGGVGTLQFETIAPSPIIRPQQTSTTFAGLTPGTYLFQVTDANGCTYQESYTIDPVINITVSGQLVSNVSCNGGSDGAVMYTVANFATNYNYRINGGALVTNQTASTINLTGLAIGSYQIDITDNATGCTATTSVNVTQPTPLLLSETTNINANCNFGAQVTVTASGGTPNYNYAFVQNGVVPIPADYSNNNSAVLDPGINTQWDVYVMDANNCTTMIDVTITTDPVPSGIFVSGLSQCPDVNGQYTFTVNATTVAGPVEYSIGSGFQSSPTFTVDNPGSYDITVRDSNGCINPVPFTITILPPLTLEATITYLPTCADNDGIVDLLASGGSNNYEYRIDGNSYVSGTNFTGVSSGVHTFEVRDTSTGCTYPLTVTLSAATPVTGFALSKTDVTCNGGNDGSITATLTTPAPGVNDNPIYMYSLSGTEVRPDQTSNIFTDLIAGNYTVQVTSGRGCIATQNITVDEPALINVPIPTVVQFGCPAGTNGANYATITVNGVTGGSGVYSYEFIKGATVVQSGTNNIYTEADLLGGTYSVNVYDDKGCIGSAAASITINPFISLETINVNVDYAITCVRNEDITVTVDTEGGIPATINYTVEDDLGGVLGGVYSQTNTTGVFTNLPIGNYLITATNPTTGCSIQSVHYVSNPNTFELIVNSTTDVSCFGGSNGTATVTFIDREPTPVDEAGAFSYTVVDALNAPVTNGVSPNAGPLTVTNLAAGVYTITATLTNSPECTVSTNFTINQPATALAISETHTAITCVTGNNDGTISAYAIGGWPGGYEFELAGPVNVAYSTQSYFTDLTPGTYTVNVRDNKGCIATTMVTLVIPPPITLTASSDMSIVSCFGDTNATITVNTVTGGQGSNYSYTLNMISPIATSSGPQLSPVFSGLGAGTYTVSVIDGYTCAGVSNQIVIDQPAIVNSSLVVATTQTCQNLTQLTLSATGGTGLYSYSDNANFSPVLGSFASSINIAVPVGTHQYYVRDANGCVADVSNSIKIDPLPALTIDLDLSNAKVNCRGDNSGVIVATAEGGLGNYIYTLLDGGGNVITPAPTQLTPGNFTGLFAGNYMVRVDSDDCQETSAVINIAEPATAVTAAYVTTDVTCNGANDGQVVINASGGTGAIQYAISPNLNQFDDINIFTDLAPGNYDVIVQDANGCYLMLNFDITEPTPLFVSTVDGSIIPELCSGDNDGAFSIEVTGGIQPYSVALDDPAGTYTTGASGQTIFDFTGLNGGLHTVYILDAKGCTVEWEVPLPEPVNLSPTIIINYDCINNSQSNTVTVLVDESNDPSDVDYALDTGSYQASNTFTNLTPGTHYITARHTNGCEQSTLIFTIDQVQPLTLAINDGTMNEIVATATGGGGNYQYTLNGESYGSTSNFIIYRSGDYTVTVTDANGCTASATRYFEYIDVCIPNHFSPNGDGIEDGWAPGCTIHYTNLTFDIFDRYGRKVATYRHGEFWDGKYNGKELPSGDYWYVLKLNDPKDNREFVGHFTLYR